MVESRVEFKSSGLVYDSTVMAMATRGDADMNLELVVQGVNALGCSIAAVQPTSPYWAEQIHKIKGLAASLGAGRLADAAHIAECCEGFVQREAWLGLLRRELSHLECRIFRH
jgi:hypothetical protein